MSDLQKAQADNNYFKTPDTLRQLNLLNMEIVALMDRVNFLLHRVENCCRKGK